MFQSKTPVKLSPVINLVKVGFVIENKLDVFVMPPKVIWNELEIIHSVPVSFQFPPFNHLSSTSLKAIQSCRNFLISTNLESDGFISKYSSFLDMNPIEPSKRGI